MPYQSQTTSFTASGTLSSLFKRGQDAAPLLVFLSGAGEKGQEPQALIHRSIVKHSKHYAAHWHLLLPSCPASRASWPTELVHACIQSTAAKLGHPPIIIAGISMGGRAVYELLYEYAAFYTAAICLAAFGIPNLAPRCSNTALWIGHGTRDDIVPIHRAHEMAAVLTQARTQYYPRLGHCIEEASFSDPALWQWLQHQVAESASSTSAT